MMLQTKHATGPVPRKETYADEVRQQLNASFILYNSPCQHVDGGNKPEVEMETDPELVLPSVTVSRSEHEYALFEPSINSLRVSFKVSGPASKCWLPITSCAA